MERLDHQRNILIKEMVVMVEEMINQEIEIKKVKQHLINILNIKVSIKYTKPIELVIK